MMKFKSKRATSVAMMVITSFLITTTSSCYLKGNNPPPSQHYDQRENGARVSRKDLNKFSDSVRMIEGQAVSYYKMALHFNKNRRYELAIEELEKAVQLDPSMAKAYNAMGVSYDKLGKNSQAIHCYQLALKIDSNLDYVLNNLGYSYLHTGNLDAAIESFQKAIKLNDDNRRYHNNLALAYVMGDRYEMAIKHLQDLECRAYAKKTVGKLAHLLGKRNFKKRIDCALEKMGPENVLIAEAKPVPQKPVVIRKKIYEEKAYSSTMKPSVTEPKFEFTTRGSDFEIKSATGGKSSPDGIQIASTAISKSPSQRQKSSGIEIFPPTVDSFSESSEIRIIDINKAKDQPETVVGDDSGQMELTASSSNKNKRKNIDALRHIKVMWNDSVDKPRVSQDIAPAYRSGVTVKNKSAHNPPKRSKMIAASSEKIKTKKRDEDIVELEIANGNGVNGMAKKFQYFLRKRGFKVVKITNAKSFNHITTKILYYNGHRRDVDRLLQEIDFYPDGRNIIGLKNFSHRIKMIIGKDMIRQNEMVATTKFK